MRKIPVCCACATDAYNANATARAKSPTHFRFLILDFRLSEEESKKRFRNVLCTDSLPDRKSAIENGKSHLMTQFARSSTRFEIIRSICFAALRLMTIQTSLPAARICLAV